MNNRRVVLAILTIACLSTLLEARAQDPPVAAAQQAAKKPPIPALLKKTVGFLRVWYKEGGQTKDIRGTCFFLDVADDRLPDGRTFRYLVTNRHMVQPKDDLGHLMEVTRMTLRLNLITPANGQYSEERMIPLSWKWYLPEDPSVDLAVLPMVPDEKKYDYIGFPFSLSATKDIIEKRGVAEGDRVLYTGFFYQYPGMTKNQPVVREGIIAMMPDEKVPTTMKTPGYVYMADVHVFGGNSGSPIFVSLSGIRAGSLEVGGPAYQLWGVISGYYVEEHDFQFQAATTVSGISKSNSGISIVVPVDQLKNLIECPELKANRDKDVASFPRPNKP